MHYGQKVKISMVRKQTKASDLGEAAILERAKSMATDWMWAVSLQHDRIVAPRPQDQAFHPFPGVKSFNEADIHFLAIALRRLRQVAATIEHAPQQWEPIRRAIENFDARLPWLKRLRDVFEHLEDYAIDSNLRKSTTSRRELQVWMADKNGLKWLGYDVNWEEAYMAAKDLYGAILAACKSFASQRDKGKSSTSSEGKTDREQ